MFSSNSPYPSGKGNQSSLGCGFESLKVFMFKEHVYSILVNKDKSVCTMYIVLRQFHKHCLARLQNVLVPYIFILCIVITTAINCVILIQVVWGKSKFVSGLGKSNPGPIAYLAYGLPTKQTTAYTSSTLNCD